MSDNHLTLSRALRAGAMAGFLGAGLNNIWSLIASALGASIPPGFFMAVTISSILPALIGAILFFVLLRFVPQGKIVWLLTGVVITLASLYPAFTTTQLQDGTTVDDTFPLLVVPMHLFSGFLSIWGIPRWSW